MEENFMKKILSVLLVALVALAFGVPAQASFNDAGVVRVIYRTDGTVELATSLGQVSDFISGSNLTVGDGATLGFDLSKFGTGAAYQNLRMAYWAFDSSTGESYVSGNSDFGIPTNGILGAFDAFQAATNSAQVYYRTLPPANTQSDPVQVSADKNFALSYWNKMNSGGGTTGKFKTFLDDGNAEISLANLASGGSVDLGFYKWDFEEYAAAGDLVATIRTLIGTDGFGQTIVNPSGGPAVPVPAAVWLFGTGLVGLVGIRRRKN
jgi:hypothetical protein